MIPSMASLWAVAGDPCLPNVRTMRAYALDDGFEGASNGFVYLS